MGGVVGGGSSSWTTCRGGEREHGGGEEKGGGDRGVVGNCSTPFSALRDHDWRICSSGTRGGMPP